MRFNPVDYLVCHHCLSTFKTQITILSCYTLNVDPCRRSFISFSAQSKGRKRCKCTRTRKWQRLNYVNSFINKCDHFSLQSCLCFAWRRICTFGVLTLLLITQFRKSSLKKKEEMFEFGSSALFSAHAKMIYLLFKTWDTVLSPEQFMIVSVTTVSNTSIELLCVSFHFHGFMKICGFRLQNGKH